MENSWKRGRYEKAKSSPACCRMSHEYPPGYTVFECRLDGNQPIAQVVHVPSDTTGNVEQNKTCMLLETKRSECGPLSRVVAYPACGKSSRRHPSTQPMCFALESRDSPGGAVACAEKVAQRADHRSSVFKPVTILETTKGSYRNGPSSRLMYGPVSHEVKKSSETYRTPGFYIQCTTTPEGPIARVTEVPQKISRNSKDPSTNYEAFVGHDGSCPRAVVTQSNKNKEIAQGASCEWLETRVDASGPCARALTIPEGSSNFRRFTNLNVRPQDNGPFARITQHLGYPQEIISGPQPKRVNSSDCRCDFQSVIHAPNPVKSFNIKRNACKLPTNVGKRNGLYPTDFEAQGRTGVLKNNRIKRGKIREAATNSAAYCCRPVSCPSQVFPICRVQPAPCASKMSPVPTRKLVAAFPSSATCPCPVKQQCIASDLPFSEMRPLPGGSVMPQCPPPSLPEIAPVPLGPNQLRNYKPLPKKSKPRKATSASSARLRRVPKLDSTSTEPDTSPEKKKTKNKKTGSSGKHRKSSKITDEGKDENLTPVTEETYVECPAFASRGVQSVCVSEKPTPVEPPAYESKGNQSVRVNNEISFVDSPDNQSKGSQSIWVDKEASYVECPAFESKGNQAIRISENPTYVECPAFASKGSQAVRVSDEPTYVECPAFESKGNQAVRISEKPNYVKCPAFESKRDQSVCVSEKPIYVKCPAFESKGNQATHVPQEASYIEYLALKSKRKQSVRINDKATYVECPAFEINGNQSVVDCEKPSYVKCPAFESKGNQSVSVCKKLSYVKCPAFESKGNQSVRVCEKPAYVECPAFASKENQSVLIFEKPSHVECPAFESRGNVSRPPLEKHPLYAKHLERMKSVSRFGESGYVQCPAFASRNSSETSSAYVPREPIPEPSSKHRKYDHNKEHQKDQQSVPSKTKKGDVELNDKTEKLVTHNFPKKHKLSLKVVKSRELRAGVVYYDCDCYHRNGLQQDCPRGGCGGLKHCVNKPWPKCDLSRYFKDKWGKYDEILDLIPPTTYCGPKDALYRTKIGHHNDTKAKGNDDKLEKHPEDLTKIENKTSKPIEKKADHPKRRDAHIKHSDECGKVHDDMVQQYAIIPVTLDDYYRAT